MSSTSRLFLIEIFVQLFFFLFHILEDCGAVSITSILFACIQSDGVILILYPYPASICQCAIGASGKP